MIEVKIDKDHLTQMTVTGNVSQIANDVIVIVKAVYDELAKADKDTGDFFKDIMKSALMTNLAFGIPGEIAKDYIDISREYAEIIDNMQLNDNPLAGATEW